LFYPGENGPLASLRLEVLRDGLEDYEYIQLLFARIKEIKKRLLDQGHQAFVEESIKLMTVDPSIAKSMFEFTKDSATVQNRSNMLAKKI
jgi:hypothetical protein